MTRKLTLILGGARSGKSSYAETLAAQQAPAGNVLFVATAQAWDDDMRARIARHRAGRPGAWRTLEAPRYAGRAIDHALTRRPAGVVVLDCITLLVSNVMLGLGDARDAAQPPPNALDEARSEEAVGSEIDNLLAAYLRHEAHWLVVSNEVGLGIVPAYPLGRAYRDVLGRVNQRLAAAADTALFLVAGLPLRLK